MLSNVAYTASETDASAKCPPGGAFIRPNTTPAATVIALLATTSTTSLVSRREPSRPVEASTVASRPKPVCGFGWGRVELVGTPRLTALVHLIGVRDAPDEESPPGGPGRRSRVPTDGGGRPAAVLMIGLTGGIGSGKTTVAAALARRGAVVIDADAIAREVVEPGSPALTKLVERFGADILQPDGSLDRPALAAKAFVSDDTRKDLEAITHPAIGAEFLRRVLEAPKVAIVVHDVPLLVEANRAADYAGVIVVDAPVDLRLARLVARGVAREDAERRIALQASDEDRRKVATWWVDNAGDLDALEKQIDVIWTDLQKLRDDTAEGRREA